VVLVEGQAQEGLLAPHPTPLAPEGDAVPESAERPTASMRVVVQRIQRVRVPGQVAVRAHPVVYQPRGGRPVVVGWEASRGR
jgi:hypothetical protein